MKQIKQHYQRIVDFNLRCGNKPVQTIDERFWDRMKKQSQLIEEEWNETDTAIPVTDVKELLDGACDMFVVLSYFIAQLEAAGFDVDGAMKAVNDNNEAKYTSDIEYAQDSLKVLEEGGTKCYVKASNVNGNTYYAVRRLSDDKIMKLKDHSKVSLEQFLPK